VATVLSRTGLLGGRLRRDEEFREFAARFLPTLLKGAYLLMRDVDLAEDVVQGTMLAVFRHWDDARKAPDAYSRQTLINVCRDQWRRQKRRPQETSLTDANIPDTASSFSDALGERDALRHALDQLPQQQREVLLLRYFFDLSVVQTAELLDIPEGTVKSAAHRGLEDLRVLLSPPAKEVNRP
jgi:RNA polymerase sigma-70 factor (sigma-E family)